MPTGYTHNLEQRGYDVKSWIKENVIRAMGVCVTLRDAGDKTQAEIIEALEGDKAEAYHAKALREAQTALTQFDQSTEDQLKAWYESEREKARVSNENRLKEYNEKKEKHIKAIHETEALLARAKRTDAGEVVIGTLRFALEQLQSALSFDYGSPPYVDKVLNQDLEQWKHETKKQLLWNVEYHAKETQKESQRHYDRAAEYKKLVEFIDTVEY